MRTPEDLSNAIPGATARVEFVNDFQRCHDIQELRFVMDQINRNQYTLVSVTQDSEDVYTVFFRRCVIG